MNYVRYDPFANKWQKFELICLHSRRIANGMIADPDILIDQRDFIDRSTQKMLE